MEDTKVIYHIDDEDTPYLVKISVNPSSVTLGDFKNALNKPNYKFFFKSVDADFGVVKEEITEDSSRLPCFNGKIISWLVSADSSTKSDNHSGSATETHTHNQGKNPKSSNKTVDGFSSSTKTQDPPNEQEHAVGTTGHNLDDCDTCGADSDSVHSGDRVPPLRNFFKHGSRLAKISQRVLAYETSSSMMSSDLESTSFCDSEDESSRLSSATGTTMSSVKYGRHRRQRKARRAMPIRRISEDASSFSSMTDSTMSLNVISVTLNMDTVNFLGISIVGQSNKAGDGGIYVGSIMRGGAVAQDGRIEPGDMILEVNRISFEDMSNDEAVRVLREEVQKPGSITLLVAKCWDPNPKNYFTIPRQEPVCPIDPRAWILHTNAMTGAASGGTGTSPYNGGPGSPPAGVGLMQGCYMGVGPTSNHPLTSQPAMPQLLAPSLAALGSLPPASNMTSKSLPEVIDGYGGATGDPASDTRGFRSGGPGSSGGGIGASNTKKTGTRSAGETTVDLKLTAHMLAQAGSRSTTSLTVTTDMASVVHSMLQPESGLEIHDRTWLKITIPNAFIGSDLVDWLYNHVDGFADRRDARRYATELLKHGYIRHTVNKNTFSEQCYYVFGDLALALSQLNFDDVDSVSEVGAPASAPSGHLGGPMMLQHHPLQMHSDNSSSGRTVLQNPNVPPGSMFAGLIAPPSSTVHTGSDASLPLGQLSGPHYPYPPMLYPLNASVPATAAETCLPIDVDPQMAPTFPPHSILNNIHQPIQDNPARVTQSLRFPQPAGAAQVFPCQNRNQFLNQVQHHTHITQTQQLDNSSSSCSSRSSRSSASSSSSSASSGTRLGLKHNGAGDGIVNPISNRIDVKNNHALEISPGTIQQATSFRSADRSAVQSISSASSASSASRQNGTGASAAGSGSAVSTNNTRLQPLTTLGPQTINHLEQNGRNSRLLTPTATTATEQPNQFVSNRTCMSAAGRFDSAKSHTPLSNNLQSVIAPKIQRP